MSRLTPGEMAEALDALSKLKELSPAQSRALERSLAKARAAQGAASAKRRRWTPADLEAVRAVMKPLGHPGRPRLGDEIVGRLARVLDRTDEAVMQCMKRLRLQAGGRAGKREYQLNLELRAG